MKLGGIIIGGACAIVASFISVHFFLDPAPEVRVVESSDGVVRVEGDVYEYAAFSLKEERVDALFPLGAMRYILLPEKGIFAPPFLQLSFLKNSLLPALYFWNSENAYWVPVPRHTYEDEYVYFPVTQGGVYALGEHFSVDAPTFVDVVGNLRARLPEDAVSYRIRPIATPSGGAPVFLGFFLEQGGCGGIPTAGDQELLMQDERTVQVLVNDVLTMTSFTFLMEIETAPEGCPEDMPMQVIF